MATSALDRQADEKTPGEWATQAVDNWSQLHSLSGEFKSGRSPYVGVPSSEVVIPQVVGGKATRKSPATEAASMIKSLWRKCYRHAAQHGGRSDYRVVGWQLDGENLTRIFECAVGGRIDMRGKTPQVGDPMEGETIVGEWAALLKEAREGQKEARDSFRELAKVTVDILKGGAEVVEANANGFKAAADLQQQGLDRLAEGHKAGTDSVDRRERARERIAVHRHWTGVFNRFIETFGPAAAEYGGERFQEAWKKAEKKGQQHADDIGGVEDAFAKEHPEDPDIDPPENFGSLSLGELCTELGRSFTQRQRTNLVAAVGKNEAEDFLNVLERGRGTDVELAFALVSVLPSGDGFGKMAMMLSQRQQALLAFISKKAKEHVQAS